MESTDEESSSTGHLETTADSRKGPVPYGFHPVCEPRSRSASPLLSLDLGDFENSALTADDSRVGNVSWCSCGNCVPMSTHVESLCCAEVPAIQHRVPDPVGTCVTEHKDFVAVCTNRAVLDVGLLSLHDLRADSLIRPIASRSVFRLLSNNNCHFSNHNLDYKHKNYSLLDNSLLANLSHSHDPTTNCIHAFLLIVYLT